MHSLSPLCANVSSLSLHAYVFCGLDHLPCGCLCASILCFGARGRVINTWVSDNPSHLPRFTLMAGAICMTFGWTLTTQIYTLWVGAKEQDTHFKLHYVSTVNYNSVVDVLMKGNK